MIDYYIYVYFIVGVRTGYQERKLRLWKGQGITVTVSKADIGTEMGTRELVTDAKTLGPVGGVFSLAMVTMLLNSAKLEHEIDVKNILV